MLVDVATELIVITVMIVLNAIFAAYEMALASVSHARLLLLAEQKKAAPLDSFHLGAEPTIIVLRAWHVLGLDF